MLRLSPFKEQVHRTWLAQSNDWCRQGPRGMKAIIRGVIDMHRAEKHSRRSRIIASSLSAVIFIYSYRHVCEMATLMRIYK